VQLQLLELQDLDSALDRLAHRRRALPELSDIDRLGARLAELQDTIVVAETEASDLAREQVKAEGDVEQVRMRAQRDQQRLDSGQVSSPRELENLQSEIASLGRRQADLEDIVLDVMERAEAVRERLAGLTAERDQLESERDVATGRRDETFAEIDSEAAQLRAKREGLAPSLPTDLIALYEKIRESSGGIGAAALHRGRCQGCNLTLNPSDLARIRDAAPDAVVRCEECRRILVRTPESGL
jgi:predicted  nucleic acid-binding Zn-ribbon protein